jgi:F-type H+-transporting ATPase subunit b
VELDWSTFLLEIVNVLVLVWLLKRFLFRPVMKVIEDRKAAIAKTLADATRVQTEAESARERYEQRLVTWNDEQAKSRVQLQEELAAERQRRLAALQKELEREHEQASVREAQRTKEFVRQTEAAAILQAAQFAGSLLSRIAGPELERKLVEASVEDVSRLSPQQVEVVKGSLPPGTRARITTAFPLDEATRNRLAKGVEKMLGRTVEWEFGEDPALIAGVRISLGGWVLRGNLQDELKWFAEEEVYG